MREGLARRCDPVGVVGNKSEPGLVLRGAGACLRFLTMARCRRCGAVGRQFIWSRGAGETRAGVWQEGRGGEVRALRRDLRSSTVTALRLTLTRTGITTTCPNSARRALSGQARLP